MKKIRVRCNWCGNEFNEDEIILIDDIDNGEVEACPVCGRSGYLMDLNWFDVYVKGDNENDEI